MENHRIMQAHIVFDENGNISQVTVLADINKSGDIRSLQSINKQMSGYHWIKGTDLLNQKMIENVVEAGYEINTFPGYNP
jgi:hypothetical protein